MFTDWLLTHAIPLAHSLQDHDHGLLAALCGLVAALAGCAAFRLIQWVRAARPDITDRQRLDEALDLSQGRLKLATESAGIGTWDWDIKANNLKWDARMYELYGIREQDFSGAYDAWLAGVHPEDRAAGDAAIKSAIEGVGDFHAEFRVVWPNGEVRDIESHAQVMRDVKGRATRMIGVNWDITERKRSASQIARMALYDGLTGLANRHLFVVSLEQVIARARRNNSRFAVLFLDLDHFKDVNDTLGHPVGDLLLRAAADRLQANVREVDMVARFGGDEFAIILADIQEPSDAAIALRAETVVEGIANKIVNAFSKPFLIEGNEIRSGTTVGIAVCGPDARDPETILSEADVALYRAKREYRGTYQFFDEAMGKEIRARVGMTRELTKAIGSGQLFLVYQPQIDIDTGRIVGLEALIRWHHPTLGVLGPDRFIPAAEQSGLIVSLGAWVIRAVCHQIKQWLDAGIAVLPTAVNLSGVQFKRPIALENELSAALADYGVPAEFLELELTESVLMTASRENNDLLIRLREAGYRIAIDDFGSGYSSLDYLRRYPADRIKIAQTFTKEIGISPGNDTIVRAIFALSRELGMDVVAEGVETAAQLDLLKSWGCRVVQGHYLSRPLPEPEMTEMLRNGLAPRDEIQMAAVTLTNLHEPPPSRTVLSVVA